MLLIQDLITAIFIELEAYIKVKIGLNQDFAALLLRASALT